MHRGVRGRAHEADGRHLVRERHRVETETFTGSVRKIARADGLTDLDQLIEVARGSETVDDATHDPLQPRATLAARHALAARFVRVEPGERQRGCRDVGCVVHHDHRSGTEHRTRRADQLVLEGKVELIRYEPRSGPATGYERLEHVVVADSSAELLVVEELAERRRAVDDLEDARPLHVARHCNHARAGRGGCADCCVRLDAVDHQPRQVGQRLDVVDDRRLAVQPDRRREVRRLQARHATVAFEAFDQRCLLANHVRAGTPVQDDVDAEVAAEDVLADVARRICLVEGSGNPLLRERHLTADVQEALRQTGGVAGDQASLDELMRIELHQQAVLVGAWFALVTVDHEVPRPHRLRRETPLHTRRETGTAAAQDRRALDVVVNVDRRFGQRSLQTFVAVRR